MHATLTEEIKSDQAEMRSTVSALVGKMDAWIAETKDEQKETMARQVTTEACQDSKEPSPEDMASEVERREVPTEEAAVKSSRTMKKRHRGRHVAAGRRGEPKELTRGDCGPRRRLAAACRKVSRRAGVAWRKRIVVRRDLTRNQVERGAPKRRKDEKRLWKCPECKNGISHRGLREQLRGTKRIKDPGG
jgi:hypothetical protein